MSTKLNPQVEAIVKQFQANIVQQLALKTPSSEKEKIALARQAMIAFASLGCVSEPVLRTEDFEIPDEKRRIPVRLYVPRSADSTLHPAPVLLYYHGGGFVSGDLNCYDTLLRALANRAQCLVLSVGYRLAPEHPYPAANDDAWAAVKWLSDHAPDLGADSQRIAVGGDSAGGLLAAWVAQKSSRHGLKLSLQVLLYPNLDATFSRPSWEELGSGEYLLSLAQVSEWFNAYLPSGINREDPKVSPFFETDLSGLAPALIVTADHDPLRDEGDEYAAKLQSANVMVQHTRWPGMVHGLASMAGVIDDGNVLIDQIGAALRKAFGHVENLQTTSTLHT